MSKDATEIRITKADQGWKIAVMAENKPINTYPASQEAFVVGIVRKQLERLA